MKYRVVLAARAERDRDAAYQWYAESYSTEFASRWYRGLTACIRGLSLHPERYGIAHESDKFSFELRELLFGRRYKHRVLFTIDGEVVLVLHIRHSSRQGLTEDDL